MRSIAIPVADREECAHALDVAFTLGRHLGADVVGYHMRPGKQSDEERRVLLSSNWDAWPEEDVKTLQSRAVAAGKLFNVMAGQHAFQASKKHGHDSQLHALWREKTGTPDKLMPLIGPVNDLLIASRPSRTGGRKARLMLMSALLDSGLPVLMLPQKKLKVPCRHVAIAWNRGPQEASAVHATLGLLKKTDKVTVITVGKDYKHGPMARELVGYLACHGINAQEMLLKSDSGNAGAALIKAAKTAHADVLLSGAYTNGRLRQRFFGGVTEYLVNDTSFPVILMHS